MLLLQNNKIQNIMAKIKKNRKDKIIWMEKEMEKEKKKNHWEYIKALFSAYLISLKRFCQNNYNYIFEEHQMKS